MIIGDECHHGEWRTVDETSFRSLVQIIIMEVLSLRKGHHSSQLEMASTTPRILMLWQGVISSAVNVGFLRRFSFSGKLNMVVD